jgi:hypothetical protein
MWFYIDRGEEPDDQTAGVQYYELGSDIFLDENNLIEPHPDFDNLTFNENRDFLYPIPQ